MHFARYGSPDGPSLSPQDFLERAGPRYAEAGLFPYCPACGERLFLYGVHSTEVTSRFQHFRADDGEAECPLSDRGSGSGDLEPDNWDRVAGQTLRARFFEQDNLRVAYGFCLALCRRGNLPVVSWQSMIARADKRHVWSYAGLPLWVVPYILLSLEEFTARSDSGREYGFHFVLEKPSSMASELWTQPTRCRLKKVFSSNGQAVRAEDNPFPVSREAYIEKAGDTAWIRDRLLEQLTPVDL